MTRRLSVLMIALSASAAFAQRPDAVREEYAGVLLESGRYEDAAREYRTLLRSSPASARFRLGLVRALAWGNRPREADRELEPLRFRSPPVAGLGELSRTIRLALEPGSAEARRWLAAEPAEPAWRLALARALVRERRASEAIAHFDTLLAARPSAPILVERGSAHLARGNIPAAELDLASAVAGGAGVEARMLLGDVRRARRDYTGARAAYESARQARPRDTRIAATLVALAREERPPIAFVPWRAGPGATLTTRAISDNTGFALRSIRGEYGWDVARSSVATAGVEARITGAAGRRPLRGFGGDVGIARTFERAYAAISAGFVEHEGHGMTPLASATTLTWVGTWSIGSRLEFAPAYPALLTLDAWGSPDGTGLEPLLARTVEFSAGGPAGPADIAAGLSWLQLDDGNVRTSFQLTARYPVSPELSAIYSASATSFADRSDRYWDPLDYISQGVGIEYAVRRPSGWSVAARVIPGLADGREEVIVDTLSGATSIAEHRAFALVAEATASWRRGPFEIAAGVAHGGGRAGGYRSAGATLAVRMHPAVR